LSEYHTQALFYVYLDKLDVSKTRVFEDFAITNRKGEKNYYRYYNTFNELFLLQF